MTNGLRPYPDYKDSGTAWLEDVPAHWDIVPLFGEYAEKQVKNTGLVEKTVLSLSYGRIVIKPEEKLHGLVPASFETYQIVDPGDIIIRPTDLQNDHTSLRIGFSGHRGIITSAYMCLRTWNDLSPEYGYQVLNVFDLTKAIYAYGSGLRQNLSFDDLKRVRVPVPPPDEQAAIVTFLNVAEKRIRRYIRAKQKLIKLLNEEKQAIIQQAVTHGLDPNAPMRDSGIEWLGEIPSHWKLVPIFGVFKEKQVKNVGLIEETVLSLSYGKIIIKPPEKLYGLVPESFETYQTVNPGDIIIRPTDLQNDHTSLRIGFSQYRGIITSAYMCLQTYKSLLPEFGYQILNAFDRSKEIYRYGSGTRQSLRFSHLKHILIPIPTKSEQKEIVEYLARIDCEYQTVTDSLDQDIALIHEYRTRLIVDVVTGKIDVRGLAFEMPEAFDDDDIFDVDEDEVLDDDEFEEIEE